MNKLVRCGRRGHFAKHVTLLPPGQRERVTHIEKIGTPETGLVEEAKDEIRTSWGCVLKWRGVLPDHPHPESGDSGLPKMEWR